jgi:ankyrin repeat protein
VRLIVRGADVAVADDDGDTPLHILCEDGIDDSTEAAAMALCLLRGGASATAKSRDSWTPLHVAANRGKKLVFRAIVEFARPNMDLMRNDGISLLHSAVLGGNEEIVRLVIAGGAKINLFSKGEGTPLHVACLHADPAVVKLLASAGANLEAANDDCAVTPIRDAHSDEVFLCMLEAGADPHAMPAGCGDDYLTPFQHAVVSGYVESVRACLDRPDTNIERKTLAGASLVDLADEGGSKEVVELIRSRIAELSATHALGAQLGLPEAGPTVRRSVGPGLL